MSSNNAGQALSEGRFTALTAALDRCGLDMLAVMPSTVLAEEHQKILPKPLQNHSCLLLVAASGGGFWRHLQRHLGGEMPQGADNANNRQPDEMHPVDQHAYRCLEPLLQEILGDDEYEILFPSSNAASDATLPVPLQKLGVVAGWHQTSPLGIGIHPEKGLWFAYRAVAVVSASADFLQLLEGHTAKVESLSSCRKCVQKPCLSTCPAGALSEDRAPDMQKCIAYRLEPASRCASTCIAREACPVGAEFRYPVEQIAYHYDYSLQSIKNHKR